MITYIKRPSHILKGVVYYRIFKITTFLKFFKSEELVDRDTFPLQEANQILNELNEGWKTPAMQELMF